MQGRILVFDPVTGFVFESDTTGQNLLEVISKGDGPQQVNFFQDHTFFAGHHILRGGYRFYVFNEAWQDKRSFVIDFNTDTPMEELIQNPKADDVDVYELKYYQSAMLSVLDEEFIIPIESSNPNFNLWFSTAYYLHGRVFARVNVTSGKIVSILGRRPQIFSEYSFLPNHDFVYGAKCNDSLYLSFEADSLIYVSDLDGQVKAGFGNAPDAFRQQRLKTTKSMDESDELFMVSRTAESFFQEIYISEKDRLVYRCLRKGTKDPIREETENPKGVQVYQSMKLIGEFNVPHRFTIIGETTEYLLVDGYVNELRNELGYFKVRFK